MAGKIPVEFDTGTYRGHVHPHNGYYAGDFSDVPPSTQSQLDALMTVCRDLAQPQPHH